MFFAEGYLVKPQIEAALFLNLCKIKASSRFLSFIFDFFIFRF